MTNKENSGVPVWRDGAYNLEIPVYLAVSRAILNAYERPDLDTILTGLSPAVTERNVTTAREALRRLLRRDSLGLLTPGFRTIPETQYRIRKVAIGDPEMRMIPNPETGDFGTHTPAKGIATLYPGIISAMPYTVDGGIHYGQPEGVMYGWSYVKAAWVEPEGRGYGYISVNPTYGLIQAWSTESRREMAEWNGIALPEHPLAVWARETWEKSLPSIDTV